MIVICVCVFFLRIVLYTVKCIHSSFVFSLVTHFFFSVISLKLCAFDFAQEKKNLVKNFNKLIFIFITKIEQHQEKEQTTFRKEKNG